MGVGYQASALHRMSYLVVDEDAPFTTEPPPGWPLPPLPDGKYMLEPARLRSPLIADIIGWRDRLALKYRGPLGELLSWDETSDDEQSADTATSSDLLIRYVAAVVDESGLQGLQHLVGVEKPAHDEIHRALADADRRGFSGRFPQLLTVSQFWLPFQRNLMIEEPDWQGTIERFGSSFRLADEVRELRDLIGEADPRSRQWTADCDAPTQTLWAAWQASETIARVCAAAISCHLPFWTTG